MKRTLLASCILLSGCYVDPNNGRMYPAQQYQQRQVLVYHYQVPPPNPYYRQEYRPEYPGLAQYNTCAAYNQQRQFEQPLQDCGAYLQ